MIDYDRRTITATDLIRRDPTIRFGWHSISCACDQCLNADAVLAFYQSPPAAFPTRIDLRGLTR